MAMSIPSLTKSGSRADVATRTSMSPWARRNRDSRGMSHLAANESIVLQPHARKRDADRGSTSSAEQAQRDRDSNTTGKRKSGNMSI
jgi:hypothetical protein